MSEEENQDILMAECGACGAIIPLDSESCPNCNIRFSGVSEEELGECGACGELQPADSVSCSNCGVSFVSEEVDSVDEIETTPVVEEAIEDDIEVSTEEEDDSEEPEEEDDSEEVEEEDDSAEEESDEDDSEEDEAEEEDDSAEEESDEDDSEEDEAEEESDEDDSEEEESEEMDDSATVMAFESLALAIAESGMTAGEAFAEMDSSDDNLIDAPELQKGIEKIGGDKLSPSEVTAILNYLDTNEDRRVDANELVKALEDLRIGIKPGKIPKIKQFPSPMQKMLMGKKANDVFYPIAYFLMVTFIGLWVVNGMGLLVDGTGGNIIYEGHTDATGNDVEWGTWSLCEADIETIPNPCSGELIMKETYPCDPKIDANDCSNSLTPFSGENDASSMPAGFYNDGIVMIILGIIGLAIIAYLHLSYAPSLRERAKKKSGKSDDEEDDDSDEDDDDDDSDDDDSDDDEDDDSDEDDDDSDEDDDDDSDEDDDDDDSDEDDDEDYDDDDIDVGDWVGLDIDGDEFFGEIIEFDDDEGTVTIETEDGEEITGDQDDMFVEDDEDDE